MSDYRVQSSSFDPGSFQDLLGEPTNYYVSGKSTVGHSFALDHCVDLSLYATVSHLILFGVFNFGCCTMHMHQPYWVSKKS
jgi:hypothetical protein